MAAQASKILAELVPVQGRGTVSEMTDERTVRYYLSEGLLSPASEKQGTASVFGYLQLLQLIVVKKLQSEHLPIRKIKELVDGRTERDLERLLGIDGKPTSKNEALSYLEKLLTKSASPITRAGARNQSDISSPLSRKGAPRPSGSPLQGDASSSPATWERVEIEPGLELHVRRDYVLADDSKELRRLTRLLINAIEGHSAKFRR